MIICGVSQNVSARGIEPSKAPITVLRQQTGTGTRKGFGDRKL